MVVIKNHRLEGAPYVASPNKGGKIDPIFIVQHYTAGYTAESAINTLTRKGSGVSAHVTVDLNGEITQHVPFNVKAWHAGPSRHMGYRGLNDYAIGIEIVNIGWLRPLGDGNFQDSYGNTRSAAAFPNGLVMARHPRVGSGIFAWPRYTPEQLHAVDELTEALCNKYAIMDIVSHEEIDTRGWKTDPGPAFPMKLVQRHLKSNRGDDNEAWEVTANKLNVRAGPGSNFDVVDTFVRGRRVAVVDRQGDWVQIDDDHWVHGAYLKKV